ncbi:D-lyxose ketol-isomerase [Sporomusaceae bacterium BoRhaA]|uniref:D-lyxose/D-mannose family sugar isomerase n=1 Tax=Pelorhabdus rhamnosifermentans TaxID=2772457 RepID=UPI001C0609EA|nr:D-lyxose/D-mannose family sugar isomerase [Pelorhabdus rhamnosifermentans]MBU2701260.1 D-lyxose ketol-isomerase [Pelorhabdus rhamnosifermentans]
MKRSEINNIIEYTIKKAKKLKFPLPPFAYYTPDDWRNLKEDQRELVDNMLGWDVTDFGKNDFEHIGLTIFTFRNGNFNKKNKYPKPYCEKLLFVREGQILPFHFHWYKMEYVINRGGGTLKITLYNSNENEDFNDTDVEVPIDGKIIKIKAGEEVFLEPGQSVTLSSGQYHQWQGVPGTGDIALFEVSTTNDDRVDNRFYEVKSRLPEVEEDEVAKYLMFNDYDKYVRF